MSVGFLEELEDLINRYSKENGSDTPDFILAMFLAKCLSVFDDTLQAREKWYGRSSENESLTQASPKEIGK